MNIALSTFQRQEARRKRQFPEEIIDALHRARIFDIWVPDQYGGLDLKLEDGLKVLKKLAYEDASLGWIATLCSGANYFLRHLPIRTVELLTAHPRLILGGSGAVAGRAEALSNGHFVLKGKWPFATAAPHLSHFTLSAPIYQRGQEVLDALGQPCVRSFVVPADVVQIYRDWTAPGMQATATHSFVIAEYECPSDYSFQYHQVFTPNTITALPFSTFADATLLVCFLGLVDKMIYWAGTLKPSTEVEELKDKFSALEQKFFGAVMQLENEAILDTYIGFHEQCILWLQDLGGQMYDAYRRLGLSATSSSSEGHLLMLDFLTMSQHAHFRN